MKYRLSTIICVCFAMTLASCGLIDMEFDPYTQQVTNMRFSYDTVYVMKGDTFFLAPYIYPDTVSNSTIYLHSVDDRVVGVQNDTIYAADEGTTKVIAISVSHAICDTCTVVVMPRWADNPYQYLNDMVVYAHILMDDYVPGNLMRFGAFFEDELRGLAIPMNEDRTLYRFRVWSNQFYVSEDSPGYEDIVFRAYNPLTLQLQTASMVIPFDGQSHGTPSNPIELIFK